MTTQFRLPPGELTSPTSSSSRTKTATRPGRLRVRLLGGEPEDLPLDNGAPLTFGRSRASSFVIPHASVSKVHFRLRALEDGVEVEDLGSKNGTWYAGRRIRRLTLVPGDKFWAGECEVELIAVDKVDVEIADGNACGLLYGESVAMREYFALLDRLAPVELDLLIEGESGTGKELTARTIHELSPRRAGPFVVLDCSTLPATLADATIFGFRRGAFTGAENDQAGLFEQASGGTLFIDEIGELSADMQLKFLRALDRREVSRLGEPGKVRKLDLRVVAATNRDLMAEIHAKRFRNDLFHRVAHGTLRLPPLRERGLDAVLLAELFLAELAPPNGPPVKLADDAKTALLTFDWPGNVRELENVIRRTALVSKTGEIKLEDLDLGRDGGWGQKLAAAINERSNNYESMHVLVDRIYLAKVLEDCGTISGGARHLGITRARLRSRLQALGLYDTGED